MKDCIYWDAFIVVKAAPPAQEFVHTGVVTRQLFLPVASVVFAAFAPCLTVDFKLYSCDNL